jgi:putative transcriptional regulator
VPIKYKIDILEALKAGGYNTTRLRREKLLGESVIQKLRGKKPLSWHEMGVICHLLNLQPGDLVEFVTEDQPQ